MSEQIRFTQEQLTALFEGANVIKALGAAVQNQPSHGPKPDEDLPPDQGVLRVQSQSLRWTGPSEITTYTYLQRMYGKSTPVPLRTYYADILDPDTSAPYLELPVTFAGMVDRRTRQGDNSPSPFNTYMAYQIHEPDTLWHGLGVIVCSQETVKNELMPVSPGLQGDVTLAAERLAEMAADAQDPQEAEELGAIAQAAQTQTHIVTTSFVPVETPHIANTQEAEALTGFIKQAVVLGKPAK